LTVSVRRLRLRTVTPRHQLVEPIDLVVGDAFQNPCEPCLRIDLVQLGGLAVSIRVKAVVMEFDNVQNLSHICF